jgi:beta-exotoxin I transport system ATP-binding protein
MSGSRRSTEPVPQVVRMARRGRGRTVAVMLTAERSEPATDNRRLTAAIELRGLTKRYGRSRGIDDVNLVVQQGEVFGFLGPNGAGKTTTIRTLLGLLRPTSGNALILGADAQRDGVLARSRTGFLPGDFDFDPRVSGGELLDLLADLRGVSDRTFERELVRRLGAELHRPLGDLSRGNRQKIGLVQALAHHPPVVVMDEPTSGLDPLMQEEFERLVDELRSGGTTVFLSSHNLDEVERMCDRVGILRDGHLITVESVDALTGRALRRIVVTFEDDKPTDDLAHVPGVSHMQAHGHRLTFSLAGDLDPVLDIVAAHHVVDLEVTRPSLEDAFATYFGSAP